ncbi:MAG: ligand-binding sensor domain-containing protein, partial [Candidatus Latescibacterota bacterium]
MSGTSAWTAESYIPLKQDEIDQPWRWRIYDEFKGQGLRSIAQDSTGAMWFGVEDGVVRYDGLTWTSFDETDGLPNGPINAICTGFDGRVYVSSDAGIGYWDKGKWSLIFPKKAGFHWPVDDLEVDQRGRIWAATPWGAVRLENEQAVVYTSSEMAAVLHKLVLDVKIEVVPQTVNFLHPRNARQMTRNIGSGNADVGIAIVKGGWLGILRGDHPVTIWHVTANSPADSAGIVPGDLVISVDQRREVQQRLFAGEDGSLVAVQIFRPALKDTFTVSLVRKQLPDKVSDWHVYDVMIGREGGIWLGLWDGQVVQFYPDAPNPKWQMWSESDGLPLQYGPRLYEDKDANIWRVTNFGGGVYRLHDQKWSQVMDVPLVVGSPITGIGESDDGWLFLSGGEIAAYKNNTWKMPQVELGHTTDALPNHRNRLLFTNDQSLWVAGLGQGLARLNLDPARGQMYPELKYQADHPISGTWFVAQDSGVVRLVNGGWTRFDRRDGLMDKPLSVVVTSQGVVWASGSQDGIAATSYFDGARWHTQNYPRLSGMIYWKSDFVDSKGRIWFGAYHYNDKLGQIGGLLCFDGSKWIHYEPPEALDVVYAMGETTDGRIWAGTHELQYFDGQIWQIDETITDVWVHSILGAKDGSLWVGTRLKGVWQRKGEVWRQYTQQEGLEGNFFESIIETADGNIWASGSLGIYRFDGQSWTPDILPDELVGEIKMDSKGNLWTVAPEWGTAMVEMEKLSPTLSVTSYVEEVTQPGNTLISWQGQDRWHD